MTQQRVLQFEYQQSLVQDSDRPGWSEELSVSVRILSEALTSGWYRQRFASRGNDFVILLAIAMHARPLKGDDLKLLVRLGMATPEDEGRLYARVTDMGLADELGMNRMTIARSTERLAEDGAITILEIPEELAAFRDSHGRFSGTKVYLIAGNIQGQFLEKSVEKANRATKSSTVGVEDSRAIKSNTAEAEKDRRRATKSSTVDVHRATNSSSPATNSRINLLDDEEDEEEGTARTAAIFADFAARKGNSAYRPSAKEIAALKRLLAEGFTNNQILAGVEAAFARPTKPRHFTHCAAIARDLARYQQESPLPDPRTRPAAGQPETQNAAALQEPEQPEDGLPLVIDADLRRAVAVYRSPEREITPDLLARFRLMAERCDPAARAAGATGADWLADALTAGLGVAKPGSLLNYADAVLSDWAAHGRSEKPAKAPARPKPSRREKPAAGREPAAHAGIREYLEKHGGAPHGDRD